MALQTLALFGADQRTILVVQEGLDRVVLLRGADRKEIAVGEKPHEIAITADGRTAYVSNFGLLEANHKIGTPGKTISVIDVARGIETKRLTLPTGSLAAPHGLKLRPSDETELFTNAEEGDAMVIFDTASGKVKRTFPLPPGIHNFIFNADGAALFAFSMKGKVYRLDPENGHVAAEMQTGSPRGLAWTADNAHLIASGQNELLILNAGTLAIQKRYSDLGVRQIFYPSASPDGSLLFAPAVIDGVVLVLDATTGKVVRRIKTGSPLLMLISADGQTAWISNVLVPKGMFGPDTESRPGGVVELNLKTFETRNLSGTPDANGLAVSH